MEGRMMNVSQAMDEEGVLHQMWLTYLMWMMVDG